MPLKFVGNVVRDFGVPAVSFLHRNFAASAESSETGLLSAPDQADERKLIMEATITQSGALYLAQHTHKKDRAGFFRHMRIAARNQPADRRTRALITRPVLHTDNGR